jgi:hypothetical protein
VRDRAAEIEPAGVIQRLLSGSDAPGQVRCVWTLLRGAGVVVFFSRRCGEFGNVGGAQM